MQARDIAQLTGPALVVLSTSECMNLHIWASPAPTLVYLNGILLFVAGLSILRVHRRWNKNWTALLTLIGWLGMAAGSYRCYFPSAPQAGDNAWTYVLLTLLFITGLFLTYKGFRTPGPEY